MCQSLSSNRRLRCSPSHPETPTSQSPDVSVLFIGDVLRTRRSKFTNFNAASRCGPTSPSTAPPPPSPWSLWRVPRPRRPTRATTATSTSTSPTITSTRQRYISKLPSYSDKRLQRHPLKSEFLKNHGRNLKMVLGYHKGIS